MAGTVFAKIARSGTVILLDDAWRWAELNALRLWHDMGLVRDQVVYSTSRGLAAMRAV